MSDHAIETLLDEERRFPPPPEFAAQANAQPDIYDARLRGVLGARGARARDLVRAVHDALRVGAAVREVVPRRQAERRLQLRRPPRRGGARRQGRLPLGGRARGRAARRSPSPTCSARSSRLANALKELGVGKGTPVGDLHGDGPRARRRDARLRAARRAAHGRLRRLLGRLARRAGMNDMGCEVLDHPGRGVAARQAGAAEARPPTRRWPPRPACSSCLVVRRTGQRRADDGRAATAGGTSSTSSRRPGVVPVRADGQRGPALPACTRRGTTAKPKGIVHTTAGYLVGVATTHHYIFDLKPETTSTGARPTSAGSPATATSSTGRSATATTSASSTRARPTSPTSDRWWAIVERYGVDDPLHGADRDPRAHEVGARARRDSTTSPRCGCSARSASRSTPRRGSGTASTSAAAAARSSTRGGRPRRG